MLLCVVFATLFDAIHHPASGTGKVPGLCTDTVASAKEGRRRTTVMRIGTSAAALAAALAEHPSDE